MLLLDLNTKKISKRPIYCTWEFRARSVPPVSGPASMALWTLAPVTFSSGKRTMEKEQLAQHTFTHDFPIKTVMR